jgi:ribonucleotide monophosphatase NagD (HAD superfamily)
MESGIPRTTVMSLADRYDYFCLDCDGVLWSGSKIIDQAFEVVTWMHNQGKKVFFITNSSGKTREDYRIRIQKFGYEACTEA